MTEEKEEKGVNGEKEIGEKEGKVIGKKEGKRYMREGKEEGLNRKKG